jgi:hypothetical protein
MAVESIGPIYETKIPGLADAADIQAAFYAYHYGAYTSVATTAGIITPSMASILQGIEGDIVDLQNRPSSGGEVDATSPVAGDFTPAEIPDGFIWVDQDGAVTGLPISATAVFTNSTPTTSLTTGTIWVDKDATSAVSNPFIPQAIIAAKGDLLAGSANDTVVVLTVGSDGQYLKADSSTTSGLAWSAPGDLTAVSAGTGITVTSGTGPIPSIEVDTATVVTLTGSQTLTNKTLVTPVVTSGISIAGTTTIAQILEGATVSATAATGTINYDVTTNGAVTYYTSNAGANWTLNVRGNASTSLNSIMSTGQSLTIAFLVTQGSTAYYQSGFQIDGSSVTPKWQGGTAPAAGNASSVDIYSITMVKVANTSTIASAFTAFASQTKFA